VNRRLARSVSAWTRHCVTDGGVLTLSEIRSFNSVNLGRTWVSGSFLRAIAHVHTAQPSNLRSRISTISVNAGRNGADALVATFTPRRHNFLAGATFCLGPAGVCCPRRGFAYLEFTNTWHCSWFYSLTSQSFKHECPHGVASARFLVRGGAAKS
jgi:hypothetical protein